MFDFNFYEIVFKEELVLIAPGALKRSHKAVRIDIEQFMYSLTTIFPWSYDSILLKNENSIFV